MSRHPSYWPRFFKRVFSETALFTTRKLLVGAFVGIITRIALLEFGKKALQEIALDTAIFCAAYITAVIGSFLINLIRVPALLDAECRQEIIQLKSALEFPDKALADHVRTLLSQVSENGKKILKFAILYDVIEGYRMTKIDNLSFEDIQKARDECIAATLLRVEHENVGAFPPSMAFAHTRSFYFVPQEFRETLKRLLYSAQ